MSANSAAVRPFIPLNIAVLTVSDTLDPLHYAPFTDEARPDEGENDDLVSAFTFGNDAVLILKSRSVYLLQNFSAGSAGWVLNRISPNLGCIAPLSIVAIGRDVWPIAVLPAHIGQPRQALLFELVLRHGLPASNAT